MWVAFLAVLFLIIGCVRDPYADVSTTHEIQFRSDESFSPRAWKVPAGTVITFEAENSAARDFEFTVLTANLEMPLNPSDARCIWFTTPIPAQQTIQFSFTAPEMPGEYDVVVDTSQAASLDWIGKLVVYSPKVLKR